MDFKLLIYCALSVFLFQSCQSTQNSESHKEENEIAVSPEQMDKLGITNAEHLSAASKRALNWPDIGNEWFIEFSSLQPLKGDLAYEEGIVRRDPSAMLFENGKYYVWYSKSTGPTDGFAGDIDKDKVFPWDRCDIWKKEPMMIARYSPLKS